MQTPLAVPGGQELVPGEECIAIYQGAFSQTSKVAKGTLFTAGPKWWVRLELHPRAWVRYRDPSFIAPRPKGNLPPPWKDVPAYNLKDFIPHDVFSSMPQQLRDRIAHNEVAPPPSPPPPLDSRDMEVDPGAGGGDWDNSEDAFTTNAKLAANYQPSETDIPFSHCSGLTPAEIGRLPAFNPVYQRTLRVKGDDEFLAEIDRREELFPEPGDPEGGGGAFDINRKNLLDTYYSAVGGPPSPLAPPPPLPN